MHPSNPGSLGHTPLHMSIGLRQSVPNSIQPCTSRAFLPLFPKLAAREAPREESQLAPEASKHHPCPIWHWHCLESRQATSTRIAEEYLDTIAFHLEASKNDLGVYEKCHITKGLQSTDSYTGQHLCYLQVSWCVCFPVVPSAEAKWGSNGWLSIWMPVWFRLLYPLALRRLFLSFQNQDSWVPSGLATTQPLPTRELSSFVRKHCGILSLFLHLLRCPHDLIF